MIEAIEKLKPATREWFDTVCQEWELGPHHIRLLVLACQAWERTQEAKAAIDAEGLTVPVAGGVKTHPAVAIERDSRLAFARLLREVNLDDDGPDESRPPALAYGGK